MLTLAKHSISLYVGSSGRCSTAWGQNEIFCQSKVLFPLVHACYKNPANRSKQNPIIWAWRNRAKLNFLSDIHWLNDIEPMIALCSFSLCMCNMFCFLWPSWMKFLRYAYIYIYHIDEILQQYRWHIYDMGVDQNIVAGVLLEMTLRPPLRFLALFRVFIVFHYID